MSKHASVLIVDDNAELAENISEILAHSIEGFELACDIARSADEANALAAHRQYHVALLDLHLLDGSGLELMGQLRDIDSSMQVVFITGDATVESAIRALERGAFGYILKPFDAEQLAALSNKAIERAHLLHERETLRKELERSEQRLREVVDQIPAFVVALDEAGNVLVWNRQLEAVTGFTTEEMLGTPGTLFQGNEEVRRLPSKGGGHRSVRWSSAVVARGDGEAPVTYSVGVDVTEELEMQQRARRAERLAAVGTLAAGLAHEVRNPLNSAMLQLQLLERRWTRGNTDQDATQATLSAIRAEIERLDRLVNDFLGFAKPVPLDLKSIDLGALLVEVIDLVRAEAKRSNVNIEAELSDGVGLVPLESQRMRQVMLNLLRNAIEAMAPAGGKLNIRAFPDLHTASVVVEVEDTGPGFLPDAPIFDAFYTTKSDGTGLGLAIVHRIVSEHGGKIDAESSASGACFRILLPQPASKHA